jgi:uncharacterized protein YbaA (DUF1428 family)
MAYIDGIILPVHPDQLGAYLAMAETFAQAARKLGAISVEGLGDGLEPGKLTSFPTSVQATEGENVIFSFIIWPDKAARDAGWEQIMATPELHPEGDPPFDGKRMFWGGFKPIVGADALAALLATVRREPQS